jgi:type 1 fimbria pilin
MKLRHSLLAAALFAAASSTATAQVVSGVVTLGGSIVPSSCTLDLADSGIADFGQIDAGTLSSTAMTMQPFKSLKLDIECTGPTLLALTIEDNKDGTAQGSFNNQLGLGLTSTGARVGRVGFVTLNPVVNSSASTMIMSSNSTSWVAINGFWDKTQSAGNKYRAFGTAVGGPVPLTTASTDIEVHANINSRANLQLTQSESLDGNATIEITYL